jgi:hypothetical protein
LDDLGEVEARVVQARLRAALAAGDQDIDSPIDLDFFFEQNRNPTEFLMD